MLSYVHVRRLQSLSKKLRQMWYWGTGKKMDGQIWMIGLEMWNDGLVSVCPMGRQHALGGMSPNCHITVAPVDFGRRHVLRFILVSVSLADFHNWYVLNRWSLKECPQSLKSSISSGCDLARPFILLHSYLVFCSRPGDSRAVESCCIYLSPWWDRCSHYRGNQGNYCGHVNGSRLPSNGWWEYYYPRK